MPRPRTFDEVRRAELFAMLQHGLTLHQAARYLGCTIRTIHREAKRDPAVRKNLKSAEISSRLDPLKIMHKAANTHWRAAAWLLERTEPGRFGSQRGSCRPDQLEDVAARLIETALEHINDPQDRRRAYDSLTAAVADAADELFGEPTRPKRPAGAFRPMTPLVSDLRLEDELRQAGEYFGANFMPDRPLRRQPAGKQGRPSPPNARGVESQMDDQKLELCLAERHTEMDKTVASMFATIAQKLREKLASNADGADKLAAEMSPRIDAPSERQNGQNGSARAD